jgi:hypothetical protein
MKTIRILDHISDEQKQREIGDVIEVTEERAELWIRLGYAILEAAAEANELECAALPRAKKRG